MQIECACRQKMVSATPEEVVRQNLLALLKQLSFPKSSIAVEVELKSLPHLFQIQPKIPNRRADIVCFGKDVHAEHALYPLLLIECKAVPLCDKVINQVVGYNHFLKAYYIAIANQKELKFGWYDGHLKKYHFIPYIPSYEQLVKNLKPSMSTESI